MAARVAARFGVLELAENYGAPPDKISRWSGDRWYRNFIRGWPSYGSGISGTNAICRANCVGIATLTSFPAKKLNLPKMRRQPNVFYSVFLVPRRRKPPPAVRTRETVRARHQKNRGRCIACEQCRASYGRADANKGPAAAELIASIAIPTLDTHSDKEWSGSLSATALTGVVAVQVV